MASGVRLPQVQHVTAVLLLSKSKTKRLRPAPLLYSPFLSDVRIIITSHSDLVMDQRVRFETVQLPEKPPSGSATIVYSILAIYAVHQLLTYLNYPILSPAELVWNAIVYLAPARLLLDAERREELKQNEMLSQTHAAKSEAMRRALGLGGGALTHKLSGGEGLMRSMSIFNSDARPTTDAPPGLGNWDNSCYQNSVLQGLSSLDSLKTYLSWLGSKSEDAGSTNMSLRETVAKLNSASNNGKQLWTPAKLKSMSSWQQQDAQEYFSKIMDELDKESAKAVKNEREKAGLEALAEDAASQQAQRVEEAMQALPRNPMEGLLAQRVACTKCGFSEGLSMIPFNCLTVPLGSSASYDVNECLDEYTGLDEISEVDCAKCTLLRSQTQLQQMLPESEPSEEQTGSSPAEENAKKSLGLPPELRVLAAKRLAAIERALEEDDFSDKTLNETCQIPKKAHVSSTKTRQAVIGRAPQSLVVHVNRSVFDELTGAQRKNLASVRYPLVLDLATWMLDGDCDKPAAESMLSGRSSHQQELYRLKAVVTHYGRHENGHYICYRRHPTLPKQKEGPSDGESSEQAEEKWWRLSDEDVSPVSEETVLAQGGVFMLFYEREPGAGEQRERDAASTVIDQPVGRESAIEDELTEAVDASAPTECRLDTEPEAGAAEIEPPKQSENASSSQEPTAPAVTSTESENTTDTEEAASLPQTALKAATPPPMRTAHGRKASRQGSKGDTGFSHSFRPMAAT